MNYYYHFLFSSFILSFGDYYYYFLRFAGTVGVVRSFGVIRVFLSFNFRLNNIDIINYYTLKAKGIVVWHLLSFAIHFVVVAIAFVYRFHFSELTLAIVDTAMHCWLSRRKI